MLQLDFKDIETVQLICYLITQATNNFITTFFFEKLSLCDIKDTLYPYRTAEALLFLVYRKYIYASFIYKTKFYLPK